MRISQRDKRLEPLLVITENDGTTAANSYTSRRSPIAGWRLEDVLVGSNRILSVPWVTAKVGDVQPGIVVNKGGRNKSVAQGKL